MLTPITNLQKHIVPSGQHLLVADELDETCEV